MRYLQVKNWDTFQQYKDRDPKWIKLHRNILDDYDFEKLTEVQQCHLMKIWLLASKLDNQIPDDPDWVSKKIGAKNKVQLDQLVAFGFLIPYKSVQKCTKTYLETETETEKETEKKAKSSRFEPPTVEQVKAYCTERKNSVDPERFVDFYASKGWLVGKAKMKDWKASVRTWEKDEKKSKPIADPASRWLT